MHMNISGTSSSAGGTIRLRYSLSIAARRAALESRGLNMHQGQVVCIRIDSTPASLWRRAAAIAAFSEDDDDNDYPAVTVKQPFDSWEAIDLEAFLAQAEAEMAASTPTE